MILLAESPAMLSSLNVAACLSAGAAVMIVVWWLIITLRSDNLVQGDEWRYDVTRINELRNIDFLYRVFQPLIGPLAKINRALFPNAMVAMQRELHVAGLSRCWLPEEYLAKAEMIALLITPLYGVVFWRMVGAAGLVPAIGTGLLTAWLIRRALAARARERLLAIKRRLPYLLDMLTLLMQAGATFLKALEDCVHEFQGQAVAAEFNRVLIDVNMGKPRTEAFSTMRDRLEDDDMTGIINAMIQGEQLGTPLAQIFQTQADVLRIKRTQRAETMAGEAGVQMLLPGVLVMVSSVLMILGPFVLNFLYFGTGF